MHGTVLLVDDDLNARVLAETLLRLRGLHVRAAVDGAEACNALTLDSPAVVVLDLRIGARNGFEVLRCLRSHVVSTIIASLPRLLLVSDQPQPEVARFARRLGADAFLRKPVDPVQFTDTVERLLTEAELARLDLARSRPEQSPGATNGSAAAPHSRSPRARPARWEYRYHTISRLPLRLGPHDYTS